MTKLFRWFIRLLTPAGLCLLLALSSTTAFAQDGVVTREEILAGLFSSEEITSGRVFLTKEQRSQIGELSREQVPSGLVARYVIARDGQVVGRAYVDTHIVRTKRESLLISLDADGSLRRIDVTAFLEPLQFQAAPSWYQQYNGHPLSDEVYPQRAIRAIAGATLTANVTNAAVRRVLATDLVLEGTAR
ncbi:MAG: hypothetical protein CL484_09255 [Acidobacteria bacterium]|nr:hypothetical protein [Acidobacteriota bacterium]